MTKRLNNAQFERINKQLDFEQAIANAYKSGNFTTEQIGKTYGITPRSVQRIANKWGVIRTTAESNKLMAKFKAYHRMRVPDHLKVQRKQITNKMRYYILSKYKGCVVCGMTAELGAVLQVDHVDNNPMNNVEANLQVLCSQCNSGKGHLHRFGLAA